MKTFIPIIALSLLAACSEPEEKTFTGYVEAELLYLAPQDAGVVKTLSVREGDQVKTGDIVFTLDSKRAALAAKQALAAAQGVASRVADNGAIIQEIAEAKSALALAEKTFQRSQSLVSDGAVSVEKYDIDETAVAAAKARYERLLAERAAMILDLNSAKASANLAEQRLSDLEISAPTAGRIERVYRRPGEVVALGDPVVALLAPSNLKLKFFAPEPLLSSLQLGGKISFSCDGCAGPQNATISFIADQPQYTPPVIYSLKEREKLVFLVEARPDDPYGLRPGLPATIDLP